MIQHNHRFIPATSRNILLATLLLLVSGCAVTPPMVDPYSTLLPAGRKISDSNTRLSAAQLKNETVHLVVGANFATYAEVWGKFQGAAEKGGFANLAYSKETLLNFHAQWAPTRVTSLVVTELQKNFRKIVVVNDLAEAQAQKAKWIVMFDHAHIQASSATATWDNTTTIDLLNSNFQRVLSASHSEHKAHGAAWGAADAQRFMVYRGQDILRTVNTALAKFNANLAAAR